LMICAVMTASRLGTFSKRRSSSLCLRPFLRTFAAVAADSGI
jgi:hypothetical protein